ncbi:D-alanyl-D-alanine carboxypeptidase family protein [Konateibacter massiliensis]|uniref:D-alanyl-D-alanine carboxypeptidase family protein n=1 Tax=Konateibacter massiliensis TaxID=2002841 RepID=UPI001F2BBB44|nr:serine hydrolase [Konateibacter massiliensis]
MKCTNKLKLSLSVILTASVLFTGCADKKFTNEYDIASNDYAFNITNSSESLTLKPFAADLSVVSGNVLSDDVDASLSEAAALFDVDSHEVLYANNATERLYPASLTKVLTALIALEKGNLDDVITVSSNVEIKEDGAQLIGFKEGDQITLEQALHGLLMYSGNDAGVAIAEYISGSVEDFATLMNETAQSLGATNSHFVNPHGLSDDEHYTTVYDLYLIFNAAMKYDKFVEIINTDSWTTTYTLSNGTPKEITFKTTNLFLNGNASAPDGITVIGGKTGTTSAAGSCLILLSQNSEGNPYISIVLKAENRSILYTQMTDILEEINK